MQAEFEATSSLPNPEWLRAILDYDPKSGVLRWRPRPVEMFSDHAHCLSWNNKHAGNIAGTLDRSNGYLVFKINDRKVRAHRIAWAIHYGEWPEVIDHKNGVRSDNRLANLSSGTQADNSRNSAKRSNNTSGITGVRMCAADGKWSATIGVGGKNVWLGRFGCLGMAIKARRSAEALHGFSGRHGR